MRELEEISNSRISVFGEPVYSLPRIFVSGPRREKPVLRQYSGCALSGISNSTSTFRDCFWRIELHWRFRVYVRKNMPACQSEGYVAGGSAGAGRDGEIMSAD